MKIYSTNIKTTTHTYITVIRVIIIKHKVRGTEEEWVKERPEASILELQLWL